MKVWVIKFLLQRCLGVSYFNLQAVAIDVGALDSNVMNEHLAFLIMACSQLFLFHLISKVFGVLLFARQLSL